MNKKRVSLIIKSLIVIFHVFLFYYVEITWERLQQFTLSILIVTSIGIIAITHAENSLNALIKAGKTVGDIQDTQTKVGFLKNIIFPTVVVYAPTIEEVMFRLPLILAFSTINRQSLHVIVISGLLFGLHHITNPGSTFRELPDDLPLSAIKNRENDEKIGFRNYYQVVMTSILGILAGYFSVKFQSIWVAVAIHVLWNTLGIVTIGLGIGLVVAIVLLIARKLGYEDKLLVSVGKNDL